MLWRASDAPSLDDETAERIQAEHLGFLMEMQENGNVVTSGPLMDQPDVALRGVAFYRVGSLDEARRLAETDPAVVAGVLRVDVMTYWCRPGTMVKPGVPISIGE
jgi:uncharacterized protein YciI